MTMQTCLLFRSDRFAGEKCSNQQRETRIIHRNNSRAGIALSGLIGVKNVRRVKTLVGNPTSLSCCMLIARETHNLISYYHGVSDIILYIPCVCHRAKSRRPLEFSQKRTWHTLRRLIWCMCENVQPSRKRASAPLRHNTSGRVSSSSWQPSKRRIIVFAGRSF